ncbi:cyclodeaminase/cyclohydrolase family protein [Desulfobacca acetoxidans]
MDRPGFSGWTILAFVEQLAEGAPMPGGGCAASVAGALAAALGSLAGRISLKKEVDPTGQEALVKLEHQLDQARQGFLDLVDADALAYHEVVLARRRPQSTEVEKIRRQAAIASAFAHACLPPLQMANLGLQVAGWAITLAEKGSPVILADVGVMGFLAVAVVHGGLINVFSNLNMMADSAEAQTLRSQAERLRTEVEGLTRRFNSLIYRRARAD